MNKKLLIVFGVLMAGIFILGLGGYLLFGVILSQDYQKNFAKAEFEGRDFGRRIDEEGCIKEGLRRIRNVGDFEIENRVVLGHFVESCLRTSKSVDGFCDDVPGWFSLKKAEWEEKMCEKAGMPSHWACESVFDAKHTVCNFPKDKE